PEVADYKAFTEKVDARALAAALAQYSNHPLSQSIVSWVKKQNATVTGDVHVQEWREQSGSGVEGTFESLVIRLGSLNWLTSLGIDLSSAQEFIDRRTSQGSTMVGLAIDQQLAALFALQDTLKSGAAEVVQELKQAGHAVYLVTGDNRRTASTVGKLLGIEDANIAAEVRPEKKAEFVKSLQQMGRRVAFIGDGINDAPALEQADLGIAVGRATDIAQMAADIVLFKSDVHAIPEALGLAQATLRTIKQNLFWAFFYNALGIPLAALGFLSPILCAAAMGLSDVVVIGNAMRLRWWKK
ncbi:MAG TPA: HAD-IC family P-type ATPase, partial [Candidatus Limnocylindria bacterium]|nr:HAD-IC family P-type ATPase [Candidatus Limnocylindria bacterium]